MCAFFGINKFLFVNAKEVFDDVCVLVLSAAPENSLIMKIQRM